MATGVYPPIPTSLPVTRLFQFFMLQIGGIPFIFIPFCTYMEIDPPYILLKLVLSYFRIETEILNQILILIVRTFVFVVMAIELSRMLSLSLTFLMWCLSKSATHIEILAHLIEHNMKARVIRFICQYRLQRNIQLYRRHWVIFQHFRKIFTNAMALWFCCAFFLSVIYNFGTVKLRHVLRPEFYIAFPSLSVIAFTIVTLTLPQLIGYLGDTEVVVSQLKESVRLLCGAQRKWLSRSTKYLRPISGGVGLGDFVIFEITSGTKVALLEAISGYTITALLSIHV